MQPMPNQSQNKLTQLKLEQTEIQSSSISANRENTLERKNKELLQSNYLLQQELKKRKRNEQVLLATKLRLKNLLASSPAVIYSRQPQGNFGIIFVSSSIGQFGYKAHEFLEDENSWKQYIHPQDLPRICEEMSFLTSRKEHISEYRLCQKDGSYCWIQDQRKLICDEVGNPLEIIGSWQNIAARKNIEEALFQEKELAQTTLESIGEAVITTDKNGRIEYLNPVAEKITAWNLEDAKGVHFQAVLNTYNEESPSQSEYIIDQVLREGISITTECLLVTNSNRKYAINQSVAPIKNKDKEIMGTVIVFQNITEKRKLSAQLFWQANHDSLTGLMNRAYFEKEIKQATQNFQQENHSHSLLYLDLDRFKIVNDTCGHEAGDELLRQLATILKQEIRSTDLIARLGGDEFGILLKGCSLEKSLFLAEKIRSAVEKFVFLWDNNSFHVGVSIGLIMIDSHTPLEENILSMVDNACYVAKDNGRNRVYVCQMNDQQLIQQREQTEWTIKINQALKQNCFCLYKQAILQVNSSSEGSFKHYEILLRMKGENGQHISPMSFIPAAERYGLMPKIDRWVIESFFSYYTQKKSGDNGFYAINLSGASLNDQLFLAFLEEKIDFYQILPQKLCFEITETVAIANLSQAGKFIENLKKLGFSIALDDFGSGMSSFGYLKSLPCDYLKIDGNFVKDIVNDPIDEAMVDCINRMAQVIGIKTIAEYVENEAIIEKLKTLGVDYGQGYGIAMPEPLS